MKVLLILNNPHRPFYPYKRKDKLRSARCKALKALGANINHTLRNRIMQGVSFCAAWGIGIIFVELFLGDGIVIGRDSHLHEFMLIGFLHG